MAVSDDYDTLWGNDLIDNEIQNSYIRPSKYYDLDEFRSIMEKNNTDTNLSILNLNARSLVKNIAEFRCILNDINSPFDLITLEESWLDQSLVPLVKLDGYSFLHKHKIGRKEGGGLGIYIKDGINFTERKDISCPDDLRNNFDYLFVEVKQDAPLKNSLIGVFYRPPGNDTINCLTEHLKMLIPKLVKENKTIVLTSDMNINLLNVLNINLLLTIMIH